MGKRTSILILALLTLFFISVFVVSKQYDANQTSFENSVDSTPRVDSHAQIATQSQIEKTSSSSLPHAIKQNIEKEEVKPKLEEQKEELGLKSSFTSIEINTIVATHNNARTLVGSDNLSWSATLALQAQSWADTLSKTCTPSHASAGLRRGNGENIWAGYGYGMWNVQEMVQDWINEKQNYSYETNICAPGAMCGHYTQVVWNTTKEIGCGIASCTQNGEEGKIFVCRYSPAGNITNKKPY